MSKTIVENDPVTGGREHVLVVEDDDMVRDHVVRQVASLGYRVSEAPDGNAGLEIIRQQADIGLLFTDVVLPGGMLGPELAQAAEELRPDLRVLYTSGYTMHDLDHDHRPDHGSHLLQKPYRRQVLAQRLREVFDA